MHFAVSLNGEGAGHATRMTALCRELAAQHRVTIWCPSHTVGLMRPGLPGCRFHELPGLPTVYRGNGVNMLATFRLNVGILLWAGRLLRDLARELEREEADVVISDYEPFLGWAARPAGIPVILFSHQGVIDRHPEMSRDWLIAWLVNRIMMPPAAARIVSSFYNGDIGTLLRPEIAGRREPPGDFVLVYAREGLSAYIMPVVSRYPGTAFRVFPSDRHDFAQSLAACRGVIAPAGHQLTSEALHLCKPLLVFPQDRQYEQTLNARMLERSGWGMCGQPARAEQDVRRFLQMLPLFPIHEPDAGVTFRFDDSTVEAVRLIERLLGCATVRMRTPKPRRE